MLYGAYDENTKLWMDGILAISMRSYLGNLFFPIIFGKKNYSF